jgi:hypothetical protein
MLYKLNWIGIKGSMEFIFSGQRKIAFDVASIALKRHIIKWCTINFGLRIVHNHPLPHAMGLKSWKNFDLGL